MKSSFQSQSQSKTLFPSPSPAPGATLSLPHRAFLDPLSDLPDLGRADFIRTRCRSDFRAFATIFFPEIFRLRFSLLHQRLFLRRAAKTARLPPARRGAIDVVLAPRGAAKSSVVSLLFPIHAILYQTERYIVIVSATQRQASARLANIRAAISSSESLASIFEKELSRRGRDCETSLLLNGVKIDAFSAGSEIRGVTHGAWRPTWIVLDDVETTARVLSSSYRDALSEWMREVIENLGNGYTNIDLIGTLLHSDALPARLALRPDVNAETFRSIIEEARRQDLWDEWRAILADLSRPDRLADARRFFEERRREMLAGSRVLWSDKEDYHDLQLMRAARGAKAFDQEKQNLPPADGDSLFSAAALPRFTLRPDHLEPAPQPGASAPPPRVDLASLRVFGFLDPALGESKGSGRARSGDFAAIITVGLGDCGYLYVLDAWLERAAPSTQIAKIIELHKRWRYEEFGVETNMFQKLLIEPLDRERDRLRREGRAWELPVREVRNRHSKIARIAAIEPLIRNGWVLFADSLPEEFFRQLSDFPRGPHDDAPDALEAAITLARSGSAKLTLEPSRPAPRLRSF